MRARPVAWGFAAVAVYLVAALVSFRGGLLPARPLYDGIHTPGEPYRWVSPPPGLAITNLPPETGEGAVPFTRDGSDSVVIETGDRQATIVFAPDAVEPRAGELEAKVVIEPLDPARIGKPPKGLDYDGNAYRIQATYGRSGEPAVITGVLTVVLRYPFGATELHRREGSTWRPLKILSAGDPLQIAADSPALGTFVAAGPPVPSDGDNRVWDVVAAAAGLLVVVAGGLFSRRRRTARRRAEQRAARRRAMRKKIKKAK